MARSRAALDDRQAALSWLISVRVAWMRAECAGEAESELRAVSLICAHSSRSAASAFSNLAARAEASDVVASRVERRRAAKSSGVRQYPPVWSKK
jgi:hypothetical protein